MIDPASNVEMIEACLSTPPDEHLFEMEEEWWHAELGERPATYFGMTTLKPSGAFIFAAMAWAWQVDLLLRPRSGDH